MSKKRTPPTASDDQVRALLLRYRCPVPFHAVRTRFLGQIASPDLEASPMTMLKSLWGGELPAFDTIADLDELIGALIMGLWNRLSRHQERTAPFRLTRIEVPATREGVAKLALLRREELDGFADGLFGENKSLDLPERAHKALGTLAQIRGMLEASRELADDASKPADPPELAVTLRQLRELTRIAEHELQQAVLSCARARRQMMRALSTTKPVLPLIQRLHGGGRHRSSTGMSPDGPISFRTTSTA